MLFLHSHFFFNYYDLIIKIDFFYHINFKVTLYFTVSLLHVSCTYYSNNSNA